MSVRIHLDFDALEARSGGIVPFSVVGASGADPARGHVWQAGGQWRAMTTGGAGRGQHADRLKAVEAAVADAGLPAGLRGVGGGVH